MRERHTLSKAFSIYIERDTHYQTIEGEKERHTLSKALYIVRLKTKIGS
jgi:hypothetical protein